jgi:o-succinylbenzoate---CoA ligase
MSTTTHDLRHHYESILLAAGESVVAIAERLGHENATQVHPRLARLVVYMQAWSPWSFQLRRSVSGGMQASTSPVARRLDVVEIPLGTEVLDRVLPAIEVAFSGGPAVLPVPERPAPVRAALVAAMRPSIPIETVDDDVLALVVPTSGSTGEPKGVQLGVAATAASTAAAHARLGGPGRWLLALPATHVAGLMVLARSVVAGTTPDAMDLTGGFGPAQFAIAARGFLDRPGGRRYTALVPHQLAVVLDAGAAALEVLTAFDAVLVGGSSSPPELLDRARAAGVRVVTTYGMTETCGGCVYDGIPLDGVRVRLSDDGRIKVAGPVLAHGYRLQRELTAQAFTDGWFASSDLGRLGPDGRLTVVGRVDDIAVSGGVNIPLAAVDSAIATHPGVAGVATVALPDPTWGQRVVAVLVPRDPADPPTLEAVRAHVARQAPATHQPKELVLVASLPRLSGGKVDRRAVAARLLEATTA